MNECIREHLQRRALQVAPFETCGFILNDGQIIEVANVAVNPTREFAMGRADLTKKVTLEQISRIIAVWHTHPNGSNVPSAKDIEAINLGAIQPDWLYLIATKDEVTQWNPKDYMPQEDSWWSEFIA